MASKLARKASCLARKELTMASSFAGRDLLASATFRPKLPPTARKFPPRIVHLPNLPLKLMLPDSRENIREFALRTIPSANKIEIKRVLESVYGLKVSKVNTLNMDGKKRRLSGGWMLSRPAYKKAYVVLQEPVSLPENLFPFNFFEEQDRKIREQEEKEKKEGKLKKGRGRRQ